MKKIAILSFYRGSVERGVENWTSEISRRLGDTYDITVFQNDNKEKVNGFKVISTKIEVDWKNKSSEGKFSRRFFLDYWSFLIGKFSLKILPLVWRGNYDLVVSTDGGWEPAIFRILTSLKRKKLLIVGHSGIGWDDRFNLWCFPDIFVALSSFAEKWAKMVNPFVNVVHIGNGVDLDSFSPNGPTVDFKLKHPIILCVSALIKNKRIDRLIKAVHKLKNASLILVGKGELQTELEELGSKLLGSRFAIKSYSYRDMPKVYRSCDIFASTSSPFYPFEMVLVEAMATNLAVVADDDPIRKEIVGKGGILADPEDIDGYAASLKSALITKWGNKPREQAGKFSWVIVSEKYKKVISELI